RRLRGRLELLDDAVQAVRRVGQRALGDGVAVTGRPAGPHGRTARESADLARTFCPAPQGARVPAHRAAPEVKPLASIAASSGTTPLTGGRSIGRGPATSSATPAGSPTAGTTSSS